jgi:hypothetical protein
MKKPPSLAVFLGFGSGLFYSCAYRFSTAMGLEQLK